MSVDVGNAVTDVERNVAKDDKKENGTIRSFFDRLQNSFFEKIKRNKKKSKKDKEPKEPKEIFDKYDTPCLTIFGNGMLLTAYMSKKKLTNAVILLFFVVIVIAVALQLFSILYLDHQYNQRKYRPLYKYAPLDPRSSSIQSASYVLPDIEKFLVNNENYKDDNKINAVPFNTGASQCLGQLLYKIKLDSDMGVELDADLITEILDDNFSPPLRRRIVELMKKEGSVELMVEQMKTDISTCIGENEILGQFACELMRASYDFTDKFNNVKGDLLATVGILAVLLNTMAKEMVRDPQFANFVIENLYSHNRDSVSKMSDDLNDNSIELDYHNAYFFLKHIGSMRNGESKDISSYEQHILQNSLQLTILKLVHQNVIRNSKTNAKLGFQLATNAKSYFFSTHNSSFSFPVGKEWADSFIAFHLATIASGDHKNGVEFTPLLIPQVLCTNHETFSEDFLESYMYSSYVFNNFLVNIFSKLNEEEDVADSGLNRRSITPKSYMTNTNFSFTNQTSDDDFGKSWMKLANFAFDFGQKNLEKLWVYDLKSMIDSLKQQYPFVEQSWIFNLDSWSPTSSFDIIRYTQFSTVTLAGGTVIAGVALEMIVGPMVLDCNVISMTTKWRLWILAQILFSPLLSVTILSRSVITMPLLIPVLFKFGFPEILGGLLIYTGYQHTDHFQLTKSKSLNLKLAKAMGFLDSLGLLLHHTMSAYVISAISTGLLPLSLTVISGLLPLVIQHIIVPVKYYHFGLYSVLEIALEVIWEWQTFLALSSDESIYKYTGLKGIALGMILAHWFFFTVGTVSFITIIFGPNEADIVNDICNENDNNVDNTTMDTPSIIETDTLNSPSIIVTNAGKAGVKDLKKIDDDYKAMERACISIASESSASYDPSLPISMLGPNSKVKK